MPVLASQSTIEPGIFGFFRPVLLMPEGILDRLSAEQLSAIVAHEMCHVRRRDNLSYSAHMLVEALFWFYPPVWWIGKRLIEERERACDEAVVDASANPHIYAEGILNVCKFCVASPLECVSSVTGSDLKKRITRIMHHHVTLRLSPGRKILLGAACLVAVAAPLVVGLVCMGQNPAQTGAGDASAQPFHFDIASIRPDPPDTNTMRFSYLDDGVLIDGEPIEFLVQRAFGVQAEQIIGLPAWAKTAKYTIRAKVDDADQPRWKALPREQMNPRRAALQGLLTERFNFKAHPATQERPAYCLVIAKHGPKFHTATPGDTYSNGIKKPDGSPLGGGVFMVTAGKLTIQGGRIPLLLNVLTNQGLGYPIEDQTGLTGEYDLTLHWAPGDNPAPDSSEPPLLTALQEQLGLKLELKKVPIETIVVDHIDRPSPN